MIQAEQNIGQPGQMQPTGQAEPLQRRKDERGQAEMIRAEQQRPGQVKLNLAQAVPDKFNFGAKLRDCAKLNPTLARPDRYNNDAKLRRYVELNHA